MNWAPVGDMVLVRQIKWKLNECQDLTANQNNFVTDLQCTSFY